MLGHPASPLLWSVNGDNLDRRALSAWCAYTGQNVETTQNWGWLAALHPDDRKRVQDAWREAIHLQHSITLVYRIYHIHEGYRSFNVLHVPLFTDEHQLQAWFLFFTEEPASPPEIDENWELRLIYGMIFTQPVLGIFWLSLDGAILRVNAHLSDLTGYSEKELLAMTIWQLTAPEDIHLHLQAMRERLDSDRSYPSFRVRYLCKDDTIMWGRVTQFLVRQPSGEPYYFFYMVEDISAQVQVEDERAKLLAQAQGEHNEALARTFQLETVFEAITDGIMVCDRDGKVIQSNAAVRHILHLDAHPDHLDLPFQQRIGLMALTDEHEQAISPEQWPMARLLRGEYLHEGRTDDLRIHLLDGQESYVNFSGAPMLDQDNQIIGAVMVVHDVNERHLLESRIRKSFRILLALAEVLVDIPERHREISSAQANSNGQVPSGPSFRAAGEYLTALTCQMLEYQGISISQIDADAVLHIVAVSGSSGETREDYYQKYANRPLSAILDEDDIALLRTNEVVIRDLPLHVRDAWLSTYLLAPMIMDGQLVGVLAVEKKGQHALYSYEEISLIKAIAKFILLVIERERIQHDWVEAHSSELALRETNQRFDEFLSIASHELRTPLAGIKGNLQLALRRLKALQSNKLPEMDVLLEKLDKTREFLREAEDRVNVQNRMISDLLDVSRIQANKLELVIGSCDLNKVVGGALKDQQHTTPERVITLKPPCGDRELTVIGDADRLGQVVHNYLSNALKYSPPDAPISVQIEKLADEVRVSVHDQGPGLTPEEQKHVWERFYRVKGVVAQGASTPSMGLGLHICRTIIEAHHGRIGLESTPGEGSTFWFSLPLVQPDVLESEQPSKALPQHASGT